MARKEKSILHHALFVINIWFAVSSGKLMSNQFHSFRDIKSNKIITCKNIVIYMVLVHSPSVLINYYD